MNYIGSSIGSTDRVVQAHKTDVLSCIYDAWQPALGVLFDEEQGLTLVNDLWECSGSELSKQNARFLVHEESLLAVLLMLPSKRLVAARRINCFLMLKKARDPKAFLEPVLKVPKFAELE